MSSFPGFSAEAVKFFRSLRRNNNRDWFQPRKETFDREIKAPMEELVAKVNAELARFAPDHITEPKKAIYRIYRDTRFSKDKTPYKTHIAANFPRHGLEKHSAAGFYFSVSDDGVEVAGGLYMPDPPALLAVRNHIAANHQELKKIVTNKKLISLLGDFYGESLARPPKGFDPNHPAIGYLKMKQWLFYRTLAGDLMTKPMLLKEVTDRLKAVSPLIQFLNAPLAKNKAKLKAEDLLF